MLKTRLPNGSVPLSKNSRCRYLGLGNESSWQARCRHFIPATIYSDSTTHRSERDLSTLRSLLGTIYLRSQVISNVSDDVVPRDCSPISLFGANQTWCIRPRHLSPNTGQRSLSVTSAPRTEGIHAELSPGTYDSCSGPSLVDWSA